MKATVVVYMDDGRRFLLGSSRLQFQGSLRGFEPTEWGATELIPNTGMFLRDTGIRGTSVTNVFEQLARKES